jgi:hypothetical protein
MPIDSTLKEIRIPKEFGRIVDVAPIVEGTQPVWLMLAEDGSLLRVDTSRGDWVRVGSAMVPSEPDHEPWAGHTLRPHLHVSRNGEFAAVVNDYGRYGQVINLRSGTITLTLNGGEYHAETVPFSFAFANLRGQVVAVHRTAWNRLDISDPSNGRLLTQRDPTSYRTGEQRPEHYLDYFHGALYPGPGNMRIVDDGWVWHPVGALVIWELDRWLSENPWESEDGPSKRVVCARDYYWDHGITWISEGKLAIGGIGEDDIEMIDGARIFDITSTANPGSGWRSDSLWAKEVITFPGPAGKFFCDGKWLYSSDGKGLSRWDPENGARTGHLQAFHPMHYHPGAGQLVQLTDGALVLWSTTE